MIETASVLWIDDNDRTEEAKNFSSKFLHVRWCHPDDLEEELRNYKRSPNSPDLFLLDFYLGQKPGPSNVKYSHNGLGAAASIREEFPEHPIYLATEASAQNEVPELAKWSQATEFVFDCIFTLKRLQREEDEKRILYYDSLDYKKIRTQTRRGSRKALVSLLKVPDTAREMTELVLPDDLRTGLAKKTDSDQKGNTISFARWLRGSLTANPGILYTELYAATLLGVNQKGFKRISKHFDRALYIGVFAHSCDTLWWVADLTDCLFSLTAANKVNSSDTRLVSQAVFAISTDQKSKCAVCSGLLPDTVASNIENPKDIGQVHFKCSMPDPKRRPELYFEGPRVFSRTAETANGS